jgi:hypothetical protein
MAAISPEEAQAFAQRWKLVREREATERQSVSEETRFLQLSALMASRDMFGAEPDRDTGVRTVRERWDRLRQTLGD